MSGLSQEDQNFGGKTLCVVSGVGEHRGFYKFRPIFTKYILYSLCLSFVIMKRHEDCLLYDPTCDCGPLKDHIMPPWAVYAVSKVRGGKNSKERIRDFVFIHVILFPLQEEDTSLLNVTPDGHILQVSLCQRTELF